MVGALEGWESSGSGSGSGSENGMSCAIRKAGPSVLPDIGRRLRIGQDSRQARRTAGRAVGPGALGASDSSHHHRRRGDQAHPLRF